MKNKRRGHLFFSLAAVMGLPILILGIILIIMGQQSVAEGMEVEIREELAGIARQSVDLYQLAYPGDISMRDGHFFMGEKNLSTDYALADRISENTSVEISLFYKDTRMITTIRDEEGKRITGTKLEEGIISDLVYKGNEYYSGEVSIEGSLYYGYYVPIYNADKSIGGMLFAGKVCDGVYAKRNTITAKITIVFLVALLLVVCIASAFSNNIVMQINYISRYIGALTEDNYSAKMSESVLKRRDELGEMGHYAVDISQKLKVLIAHDPLTGLYNRRAGRAELAKLMDQAAGDEREKLSVVMGDIDFFKKINDVYGHECGDLVLTEISKLFIKEIKGEGFPVRWGGEEFLLVLRLSGKEACERTERLLDSIRNLEIEYNGCKIPVTMTFGVNEYERERKIDDFIRRADDLLYQGKTEGRNRIVF